MSVKEFADRFINAEYEAFHEGKFDALEKLETPNVTYHLIGAGQDTVGFEAHKQYIQAIRQMAPGVRINCKYLTGEANMFALQFTTNGARFTVPAAGFPPPTGKEMIVNSLFLFRLNEDKIAEAWSNGTVSGLT